MRVECDAEAILNARAAVFAALKAVSNESDDALAQRACDIVDDLTPAALEEPERSAAPQAPANTDPKS